MSASILDPKGITAANVAVALLVAAAAYHLLAKPR